MLNIHISTQDHETLSTWAETVANIFPWKPKASSKSAQLLAKMVLTIEGDPPRHYEMVKPKRYRPFGSHKRFSHQAQLTQTSDSASTRALWLWGHERGCRNVAESFRLLLTKVRAAYPDLGKTPEDELGDRLLAFRHAIEEKAHLVEEVHS